MKHAPLKQIINIHGVWQSIPVQLAQENNKFIFRRVKDLARAKTLEAAMGWLIDMGLIYQLYNVKNAVAPLLFNAEINTKYIWLM